MISTFSTRFVFFGLIIKLRWPPYPIRQQRWHIVLKCTMWHPLGPLYETESCLPCHGNVGESYLTAPPFIKLRPLKPLFKIVGFFRTDRKKKKQYGQHGLSLTEKCSTFFFCYHWIKFNDTWLEARSQRPLSRLFFSGRSENQDDRPGLWLADTFSTSPLQPLNGIRWNLIRSTVSTSSIKFMFFGLFGKPRWPPGLWWAESIPTSSL